MTLFDLFVIAIVGSSVVAGALRGLVRAAVTGAALLAGFVVAAHAYEPVGAALRGVGLFESEGASRAGGFLLVVGVALGVGFVAAHVARRGMRRAKLGWFDRLLGGAFGLARGLAVCSVVYLALTAFPVPLQAVAGARTAPVLTEGAKLLAACTSADVRAKFYERYKLLKI